MVGVLPPKRDAWGRRQKGGAGAYYVAGTNGTHKGCGFVGCRTRKRFKINTFFCQNLKWVKVDAGLHYNHDITEQKTKETKGGNCC